jgi:hypothetical protein
MERRFAIVLALPVVLGVVALSIRDSRPEVRAAATVPPVPPAPAPEIPEEVAIEEVEEAPAPRDVARELERERLVADYEARIEMLIQSIDWTRADSRARFPVEHDRITAEHEQAMKDARYWNQPKSFSRE